MVTGNTGFPTSPDVTKKTVSYELITSKLSVTHKTSYVTKYIVCYCLSLSRCVLQDWKCIIQRETGWHSFFKPIVCGFTYRVGVYVH